MAIVLPKLYAHLCELPNAFKSRVPTPKDVGRLTKINDLITFFFYFFYFVFLFILQKIRTKFPILFIRAILRTDQVSLKLTYSVK
jgi:hypothetical protein